MPHEDEASFAELRQSGHDCRNDGDHAAALGHFRAARGLRPFDRWTRHDVCLSLLALARHGEAQTEALQLLADAPDFSPVHRTLGLVARALGDRAGALGHFRNAVYRDGRDLWSRHDVGIELKELGRLDEAEAAFRSVAKGTPLAHSVRSLGFVARARGELERALDWFRAASAMNPDDPWFALDVAAAERACGRDDAAEAALERLTAAHPQFTPGFRERASLATKSGDLVAALRHLGAAFALEPGDVAIGRDVADTLLKLGRIDEAESLYVKLLVQRPGLFDAYRGLHRIARARGDVDASVSHLRAAAAARPEDAFVQMDLAADLLALGRAGEAEKAALAALALDDTQYRSRRLAALALKAQGRKTEALALAWKTWQNDATNPAAGFDLAADLRELARFDLAQKIYESLATREESAVTALIELAACLRRTAGVAAAKAPLDQALAIEPSNPRLLLVLGDGSRDGGDLAAAEAFYDKALEARPGFYWALVGKAATAFRAGDTVAGRRWLLDAIDEDPAEGHAQIELAADLRDGGDGDGARAVLTRIPPQSPRAVEALMAEGHIRRSTGDFAGAAEAFGNAAARFPGHAPALVEKAEDEARAGDAGAAAASLEAAVRLAPDQPAVLEALARRALVHDDLGAAETFYVKASEADPARPWPVLARARVLAQTGESQAALALLDAADLRFGQRPEIPLARADILRQTGDIAAAHAVLAAARTAFPRHPALWFQDVALDIDLGRYAEAAQSIAGAPARTLPELGRARFALSLLAAARWDFGVAIAEGEAASEAQPADGWVRNRLIHSSLLALDLGRAERHLASLARLEASANKLRGKSANPSQSHYGQIFDEFRLDADALRELRATLALPLAERPERLLAIVRAYPDSTAAAIQLFIALRRTGALGDTTGSPAPRAGRGGIPRQIHHYWDEEEVPKDVAAYMASWRAAHPTFEHRLWSEISARRFLARAASEATLAAFDRAEEPAMKADLFRLALLDAVGGIYADADDRCRRSIEPLLDQGSDMVVYQEDLGSLGNNFIAASPRHPIVGRALARATEAVNRGDADILWLSTGPGLLTRSAAEIVSEEPAMLARLFVVDRPVFLGHVAIHCLAAYKASERHWSRTAFGGRKRPRAQATRETGD